jgi:putative PEP-CTERM system histidine kinase
VAATLQAGSTTVLDVRSEDAAWPDRPQDAWLLLGLRSRGRCLGLLLLGRPRVVRSLTWEDHDLLGIFAAEIGGYLAEEQAARALAEAQRFTALAKSFSFVAHDLKNVVTQLALLLQQAKRHGDKPEFMRDTLLTVSDSVDKMRAVLLRLRESAENGETRPVELVGLLEDVAARRLRAGRGLELDLPPGPITVAAGPEALTSMVENLVDNAHEAGGTTVQLALTAAAGQVLMEVRDNGPGMSREFVAEHLFRPLTSAKSDGFGIGLYQCREWAERWGGRLDVTSAPGAGTTVRLTLPLLAQAPAPSPRAHAAPETAPLRATARARQ